MLEILGVPSLKEVRRTCNLCGAELLHEAGTAGEDSNFLRGFLTFQIIAATSAISLIPFILLTISTHSIGKISIQLFGLMAVMIILLGFIVISMLLVVWKVRKRKQHETATPSLVKSTADVTWHRPVDYQRYR